MGMNVGQPQGRTGRTVLSEINVTPLVDVMLVLLIIFMVAAGVQSVELHAEQQRSLVDAQERIEEAEDLLMEAERLRDKYREVPIDLPRVDSEPVDLAEDQKLKLEMSGRLTFRVGELEILDCLEVAPDMAPYIDDPSKARAEPAAVLEAFEPCLQQLGDKLVDNRKLQEDKEIYLLADRTLDYGLVLAVMAAVRQSGVTTFGLVAEEDILGRATSTKTPPEIP